MAQSSTRLLQSGRKFGEDVAEDGIDIGLVEGDPVGAERMEFSTARRVEQNSANSRGACSL